MKQKGPAAAPFAHLFGIPAVKSHAVNAVRRISSSRSMEVVRKLTQTKRAQVVSGTTPFVTAVTETGHNRVTKRVTAESTVISSERARCKQIVTRGIALGHVNLAYALAFETELSTESATVMLTAANADASDKNKRRVSGR